jgi:hypothetical protein
LSELQLDLDESSTGWASHLADRGIEIVLDDLGRTSIPAPTPGNSSTSGVRMRSVSGR